MDRAVDAGRESIVHQSHLPPADTNHHPTDFRLPAATPAASTVIRNSHASKHDSAVSDLCPPYMRFPRHRLAGTIVHCARERCNQCKMTEV